MNEIVAFNQTKADLAEYKVENEQLVFDYEDEQGNKDARSHVYKLRKARSAFDKLRVATKAEALEICRNIDAKAKEYTKEFDEMIAVHQDPIKRIEEREEAEKQAALDKIREDREKEEAARLADLEAKEKELKELKANALAAENAIKAKEAAAKAEIERIAREKQIAENAKKAAEEEAERKLAEAEKIHFADIAAVSQLAEDEKVAAAEEVDRLAKIEADRVADKKHRESVEALVRTSIVQVIGEIGAVDMIMEALIAGKIDNVKIVY